MKAAGKKGILDTARIYPVHAGCRLGIGQLLAGSEAELPPCAGAEVEFATRVFQLGAAFWEGFWCIQAGESLLMQV